MKLQKFAPFSAILLIASITTGCANTASGYSPIVDGPRDEVYYADLNDCQRIAKQRRYDNDDTKTTALVGAIGGALIGAIDGGSVGDALAGAAIGGAVGGVAGAADTSGERKQIVINCMAGRGHAVVG